MLVVSHFDKNYFDWFQMMSKSIELTNPELNMFIYGTNLTESQIKDVKKTKVKNVHVENKFIEFEGIQERRDGSGKDATWKIMMQCQLAEAYLSALKTNPFGDDIACVTNADMLFVKPIIDLENYFRTSNADCLLHFTKDHIQRGQIQNGFIVTKIDESAISFFECYNQEIKKDVHHYADQKALLETFNLYKNKISFKQLPTLFIDGNFRKESYVLSAHSGDRNRNKQIFKEILGLDK